MIDSIILLLIVNFPVQIKKLYTLPSLTLLSQKFNNFFNRIVENVERKRNKFQNTESLISCQSSQAKTGTDVSASQKKRRLTEAGTLQDATVKGHLS